VLHSYNRDPALDLSKSSCDSTLRSSCRTATCCKL